MSLTPIQFLVLRLCPIPATTGQRHRAMLQIFDYIAASPSEVLRHGMLAELAEELSAIPIIR